MIKVLSLSFIACGLLLHFVEWLFEFHGNGWSFATVLSVVVVVERIHHNHQTRYMLRQIGDKVGVKWQSNLRLTGLKQIYPKLIFGLPKDMNHLNQRRMSMLTNLFKTSVSKKLIALILGAAVAMLNKKLHLDLTPDEVLTFLIVVASYIVGQSHVDARKVAAGVKDSPLLNMGFTEAAPMLQAIHDGVNKLGAAVRKNDGSLAYKEAMQAYAKIKPIIDALNYPEPVQAIPDTPEQKVSA